MYIVIRTWSNAGAVAEAMLQKRQEIMNILGGVPGFVAYFATSSGDLLTTVTVCSSQAGTQESTDLARQWIKENVPGAVLAAPHVTEGETFLQFQAAVSLLHC